jgi:hypothetical protein
MTQIPGDAASVSSAEIRGTAVIRVRPRRTLTYRHASSTFSLWDSICLNTMP